MSELPPPETVTHAITNIETKDITARFMSVDEPQVRRRNYIERVTDKLTGWFKGNKVNDVPTTLKSYALMEEVGLKKDSVIVQPPESFRASIEKASKGYYWTDEYDIPYGAMVTKGNVMYNLRVDKDPNEPSGFKVFGLDFGVYSIPHRIKASETIRKLGLPTERYVRFKSIEQFAKDGRKMDIEEFKQALYEDAEKGIHSRYTAEELKDIKKFLENTTDFIITHREVQTALRLSEVAQIEDSDQFNHEMREFEWWLNHHHEKDSDFTAFKFISDEGKPNKSELKRYFVDWYPKMMARYLAKLHEAGISHGFAHKQNWELYPALVDLDSSKGEPLGTDAITEADMMKDALTSFWALSSLHRNALWGVLTRYIDYGDALDAQVNFGYSYLSARGLISPEIVFDQVYDLFVKYFQDQKNPDPQTFHLIRLNLEKIIKGKR